MYSKFKTRQNIIWNFFLPSFSLTHLTLDRQTNITCTNHLKLKHFRKTIYEKWNFYKFLFGGINKLICDSQIMNLQFQICQSIVKLFTTQEEMLSGFNFSSACTDWIDCITKTMSKFILIKMTKLQSKMHKEFYIQWIINEKKKKNKFPFFAYNWSF